MSCFHSWVVYCFSPFVCYHAHSVYNSLHVFRIFLWTRLRSAFTTNTIIIIIIININNNLRKIEIKLTVGFSFSVNTVMKKMKEKETRKQKEEKKASRELELTYIVISWRCRWIDRHLQQGVSCLDRAQVMMMMMMTMNTISTSFLKWAQVLLGRNLNWRQVQMHSLLPYYLYLLCRGHI